MRPDSGAEERLARVHAMTTRLTGLLEPEEVARTVVAEGRAAVGAAAAAVYVLDGDRLRLMANEGYADGAPPDPELPLDATWPATDVALPLVAEDRTVGSLVVRMAPEQAFDPADRVVLDVLATACGQALLLSRSLATLQRTNTLLDTIIETAPEGWALFDRDLRYLRVNEALAAINGVPARAHIGRTIAEIVPDVPESGHLEPLRRVLETGQPVEVEVRGRTAADPHREHAWRVSYYPVRSPSGEMEAIGMLIADITERRQSEDRAALLAALGPILEEVVGVEQRLERVARALVGTIADHCTVTLDRGEERERVAMAHVDPEAERALALLPATGVPAPGEGTVVMAEMSVRGRRVGTLAVGSMRPHAFGREEVALIEEVAKRAALAVDNARLFESERAARERTARLQTITAALSEALSPTDVATTVLRVGMPAVGSHMGGVWQVTEDRLAIVPLAQEGYPDFDRESWRHLPLSQPVPLTDALREGRVIYLATVDEKIARWPHLEAAFRAAGSGSVAVLPLFARGEPVGSLSLSFPRERALDEQDVAFLEAIASQCAQALERARLYEAERRVAATLQRSLLPQHLPSVEGVEFAVRYLPAAGLAAGGDFYEAIRLPDGTIGVAVGDVVGRGTDAAAAMGQLRSALRAFALDGAGPPEVLARLSAFAESVEGALAATAAYAVIDPRARELRYACAGHPWPLLASADGTARYLLGGRALPLACVPDPGYTEAVEPLEPGDTLLLFTDGLTERRGIDIDETMEQLRRSLAGLAALPLGVLLDGVVTSQDAGQPLDDVALLAVRLPGTESPVRHLRVPAVPGVLAATRAEIRTWLDEAGVDPATASDVLLAAGEALANAVEHAYRGQPAGELEVVVRTSPEIEVEISDHGGWQESGGDADRGRGFVLMRALMHSVDVDRTPAGTTVRLRRRAGDVPVGAPGSAVTEVRDPVPGIVELEPGDAGALVARVRGDLDLLSAPVIGERLAQAATAEGLLVIDLSEAGYLDSVGTRMLVEVARRATVKVVAPSGTAVRRAIEIAELDANLRVEP